MLSLPLAPRSSRVRTPIEHKIFLLLLLLLLLL